MKLICTTGPYKDKEYDLFAPGISLGREEDNDVVLPDEEASRYHAKVEYFDNAWYVHDLNSSNGVYLNGKRISGSAPLSLQDQIRIGQSTYRVAEDASAGTAQPRVVLTKAPSGGKSPANRQKLLRLGLVAGITLAAVVLVGLLLPGEPKPKNRPADQGTSPATPPAAYVAAADAPLQIYYESLNVDQATVLRYEVALVDGTLTLTRDDAAEGMRLEKRAELTPAEAATLRAELKTPALMSATSPPSERRAAGLSRVRLLLRTGPEAIYLEAENTPPPPAMTEAADRLTRFVQDKFGVFADPRPREVVLGEAREYYQRAQQLFHGAEVAPTNRFQAIRNYEMALALLKWMDDKPAFYNAAREELDRASAELAAKIQDLERQALLLKNQRRYGEAILLMEQVRGMVPDQNHEYARRARDEEQNLRRLARDATKRR